MIYQSVIIEYFLSPETSFAPHEIGQLNRKLNRLCIHIVSNALKLIILL
jgi:hypothetical protein